MMINKIFSQFEMTTLFSFPMTILGAIITFLWIFTNKKTHWAKTRTLSVHNMSSLSTFNKLLGKQKKTSKTWHPWIFSIFFLQMTFNIFSLMPYTFSHTSHLSVTFSLSVPMWLAIQLFGFKNNWKKKLSHLLPQGTPIFLTPLMMMIESLSLIMQPMTLGFRLGANLLAGHLLIFLCSCTVWKAINLSLIGVSSFSIIMVLLFLEMAVACMQAAVFLILTKKYLEEKY